MECILYSYDEKGVFRRNGGFIVLKLILMGSQWRLERFYLFKRVIVPQILSVLYQLNAVCVVFVIWSWACVGSIWLNAETVTDVSPSRDRVIHTDCNVSQSSALCLLKQTSVYILCYHLSSLTSSFPFDAIDIVASLPVLHLTLLSAVPCS